MPAGGTMSLASLQPLHDVRAAPVLVVFGAVLTYICLDDKLRDLYVGPVYAAIRRVWHADPAQQVRVSMAIFAMSVAAAAAVVMRDVPTLLLVVALTSAAWAAAVVRTRGLLALLPARATQVLTQT